MFEKQGMLGGDIMPCIVPDFKNPFRGIPNGQYFAHLPLRILVEDVEAVTGDQELKAFPITDDMIESFRKYDIQSNTFSFQLVNGHVKSITWQDGSTARKRKDYFLLRICLNVVVFVMIFLILHWMGVL